MTCRCSKTACPKDVDRAELHSKFEELQQESDRYDRCIAQLDADLQRQQVREQTLVSAPSRICLLALRILTALMSAYLFSRFHLRAVGFILPTKSLCDG